MVAHWIWRLGLSIFILVATAGVPPAKADDWPKPAEWDRKYPSDGPNHAEFYKLASVRAALVKLVGEQLYRQVILGWSVYTPIIATEDTIFVTGCKPHLCSINEVATVIQGRSISVCIYHQFQPSDSEVPITAQAERLWFIQGAELPAVERDPDDVDQCTFESMDDLKSKLQRARALASSY